MSKDAYLVITVVDANTNEPLSNVEIAVRYEGNIAGYTDKDGQICFKDTASMRIMLFFSQKWARTHLSAIHLIKCFS